MTQKKLNSRWRKGAQRYSTDKTVDDARWIADARGHKRLERDTPTEAAYVARRREGAGWHHGVRIRRPETGEMGNV